MTLSFVVGTCLSVHCLASTQPVNIGFEAGVTGWRTVLDGVMGGRSTGRVTQPEDGLLRFSGDLSLENNGGFSQTQTTVPEGSFEGATGIEARVRGDGRTYQFDVRCSDVRMMAGSFQTEFETVAGEWITIRLPFDAFRLYSFGRPVPRAPELTPARVESIGVTLADKTPGAFQLDIDYVRALGAARESESETTSLQSVASRAGLTTLLTLVEIAGLELPADGTVTIFAPTNEAFESLPPERVAFLTSPAGRATLRAVLGHHIVPMAMDSGAILQRRGILALSGQNLPVDDEAMTISGATLLTTDVAFDGGVAHVIDRVLMPETRSVSEIVAEHPQLSTLLQAVIAAGLADQLGSDNDGPWTLLAPSNEAFAALGQDRINELLADPSTLASVLGAHVIPSRILRGDMIAQRTVRTLPGRESVTFALAEGTIKVSGAGLVQADIPASNGIIHIIDRVILPTDSVASAMPTEDRQSSAAAVSTLVELAIQRGVPLFNEGSPEGCAAVYEVAVSAIVDLAPGAFGDESLDRLRLALAEGEVEVDARKRAWIFRRALDQVYQDARRLSAR